MATERFQELLSGLLEATAERKLRWQETADTAAFRIGLGSGVVRVETGEDKEGDIFWRAVLIDEHGRELDEEFGWGRSDTILRELYERARTSALNVDELIDRMMRDLRAGKQTDLPLARGGTAGGRGSPKKDDDDIPF